uniref:Craniofacial development protein 2 n=1 Tax=Cacopsylla melanoneura TaxID=428564 RepID=A0A8D9F872_9HEMI
MIKKNRLRVATWNVRTLYYAGALDNLRREAVTYNLDILAIQETRWTETGLQSCEEYTMYYGGNQEHHTFGTAFLVRNVHLEAIKKYVFINPRLSYIQLKGKFNDIFIINVHAPTEDASTENKDEYYEILEELYSQLPNYATKLIIGDFNAKIGKEDIYIPTIGRHSLHENTNENGQQLINFAMCNNLNISSTTFPHKRIHKATWISPDSRTRNQIDHILIDDRRKSMIENVRTYRGADINSDHFLVIAKIRERIAMHKSNKTHKEHFDIEKLKTEEIKELFVSKLEDKLRENEHTEAVSIDESWKNIKDSIVEAAKCLGNKPKENNKWFDQECHRLLDNRNQKRREVLMEPTTENTNQYKEIRRETKRTFRKKKREKEKENLEKMEEDGRTNNMRSFYKRVKQTKQVHTTRNTVVRNKNDEPLFETKEILHRWKEYFQELLNVQRDHATPELIKSSAEIEIPKVTYNEVVKAIKNLKNNKAPGSDNIPSELLKSGNGFLVEALTKLLNQVWKEEKVPREWTEAIIIPIHKKGDKLICENYRGITLLSTAYKILTTIINNRIKEFIEDKIGEYQCGFRTARGTNDQLFVVRQIFEKCYEYDIDLNILFIDFKQAFDSIQRSKVKGAMKDLDISLF